MVITMARALMAALRLEEIWNPQAKEGPILQIPSNGCKDSFLPFRGPLKGPPKL